VHPVSNSKKSTNYLFNSEANYGRPKKVFSSLIGEGLEPIVLPWKCHSGHIMELCDECNNCTKFQLYTEEVARDIKFVVILHHFLATK